MKTIGLLLLFIAAVSVGCGQKETPPTPPAESSSGNPVTAPVDYLGAVGRAKKLAEKTIDTTALNQLVQQFHVQEGRYPRDLNELVTQKYLPALPKAPYKMKFTYNPKTGEVRVVQE